MSLLSLPNEILIKLIFARDNITISDLFQLMLSCRQLHNMIVECNQLWMCKYSSRWPEMHIKQKEKYKVPWKNWVFSLRIIEEVKKAATSLSSQCYPVGKSVTPVVAYEKWIKNDYPIFLFEEEELHELIFNKEIKSDLTLSYYARVALNKLRTCLQVRNLNIIKSESLTNLLEGAKLISNWIHFREYQLTNKLVDNVDQHLQLMVNRIRQLVKEKNSIALEDILKCINKVLFVEMKLEVYNEDGFHDWNHEAASIHWVLQRRIGYSAILCVIYLEVATRMGIACEPFSVECAHCSEKFYVKCRVEGNAEVFYVNVCYESSNDLSSIKPSLIGKLANSFEVMFGPMLEGVVARDERKFSRRPSDLRVLTSMRFVCALWPTKVNVMNYAQICLKVGDQVADAHRLLMIAEIDSNETVMIDCDERLSSQQSVMDLARMARHRSSSIFYAVGLFVSHNYKDTQGIMQDMVCVIFSWDECYREEVSRQKWGLSCTPVTDSYRLDQPFYHVMYFLGWPGVKNFYVPQETLQFSPLLRLDRRCNLGLRNLKDMGIFFKCFDGRRFVPNAEHKAHFPEDDAVALSLTQQL